MLLAMDIGNTTIHVGIFADRTLGPTWRLATDHDRLADANLQTFRSAVVDDCQFQASGRTDHRDQRPGTVLSIRRLNSLRLMGTASDDRSIRGDIGE